MLDDDVYLGEGGGVWDDCEAREKGREWEKGRDEREGRYKKRKERERKKMRIGDVR